MFLDYLAVFCKGDTVLQSIIVKLHVPWMLYLVALPSQILTPAVTTAILTCPSIKMHLLPFIAFLLSFSFLHCLLCVWYLK